MGGIGRRAALVAAALLLLAPTQAFGDGSPVPGGRPRVLTRAGHGAAVVAALGDKLPEVAATNRMSTTRLREILSTDPTAWVGQDGQVYYVEPAEQLLGPVGTVAGAATASYPESQTFALHSLPDSPHKIFLDFNGAYVGGTYWNVSGGMQSRTYTGFSLDSDPTTFTSAEKAYIQTVWRIVAEKYAPFDVDVTTQDPGQAGYNRSSLIDTTYGDHVVITDDPGAVQDACGGTCSGIAMLGTFDDISTTTDYLQPAWVFSSKTYGSAVLTAHTVAHEVGHTFGLNHDGVSGGPAYYEGQGNWFPIMGSSARGVGQWSKGEYTGANNTQDDVAVIAANGAPLRLDDHTDLLDLHLLSDTLPTGGVADGVIGTRADTDVFTVAHNCTGDLTAKAIGVGPGASLDLKVTVLRADGTVVGSADPTSGQDASWPANPTGMDASVTVPASNATYYVRVEGVGKGSPSTTGYSDYGSLGAYRLAISNCDGTMPATGTPAPFTTTTTPTTTTVRNTGRAPSAPRIGLASSGKRGGKVTATVRWSAPVSGVVTAYRIKAQKLSNAGRVLRVINTALIPSSARGANVHLPKGRYRFKVVASNKYGASPASAASRLVRAR